MFSVWFFFSFFLEDPSARAQMISTAGMFEIVWLYHFWGFLRPFEDLFRLPGIPLDSLGD